MTFRLEYTETARRDLHAIRRYLTREAGKQTALKVVLRILFKANGLRTHPTGYLRRDELAPGLRGVRVYRYMIFFTISGDVVSVVRVLHDARNITASMFNDS